MVDFKAYERHIKGTTPFRDGYVVGEMVSMGTSHADYRLNNGDDEQVLRVLSGDGAWAIAECYDEAERILGEYSIAIKHRIVERWNDEEYLLVETVGCVGKHAVPQRAIARLGIDICRALECLEKEKLLHLSIKPDNICYDGKQYCLTGFEYMMSLREACSLGCDVGTPMFYAPQVLEGKYDNTTDSYALCLTMYYLLNNNTLPFEVDGNSRQAVITRLKGGQPAALLSVDPTLMDIVLRGCSYSPSERWQSPRELKDALIDYLEKKRVYTKNKPAEITAVNVVSNCRAFRNHFRLDELLGAGAFGVVYRAYDLVSEYECALKLQPIPESKEKAAEQLKHTPNRERLERYYEEALNSRMREASIGLQLSGCPNIVRTYETGKAHIDHSPGEEKPIGGCMWISMELLEPIDPVIRNECLVARIGVDICSALDFAHSRGFTHRDVKPENIMYSAGEGYKLGDFGVTRFVSQDMNATVTGTPLYMAPELLKPYLNCMTDAKYDNSVDIYALGLSLYSLLNNGYPAFVPYDTPVLTSELVRQVQHSILTGELLPVLPGVSKRFIEILRKACSFRPQDRFGSARLMRNALVDFLDAKRI